MQLKGSVVMYTEKYVMRSIEQLQIKNLRHLYRSIADINLHLARIHRTIETKIDKYKYSFVTDYVNQFISYTSVWNVKFVYNIESPEVAMLQIFHLEHILDHEQSDQFTFERCTLMEMKEKFLELKAFKLEHIQHRKQKMLDHIAALTNQTGH